MKFHVPVDACGVVRFLSSGEHEQTSLENCEIVVFTGGSDIAPFLYGEKSPLGYCSYDFERDKYEFSAANAAVRLGKPMIGICRGLQLLHVKAGGSMMHHIERHAGATHEVVVSGVNYKPTEFTTNSFHHQMIKPFNGCKVVAKSATKSPVYLGDGDKKEKFDGEVPEAAIYKKINAAGVQWHPEWSQFGDAVAFFEFLMNGLVRGSL